MGFLLAFTQLASIAQTLFPIFAAVHKQTTPDASNAALIHASQAVSAAQVIVAAGEQIAAAAVASGSAAPTGVQKLAIAQAVVQSSHDMLVQSGATTATFDEYWTPISAAITAVCAAKVTAVATVTAPSPIDMIPGVA